MTFEEKKKTEMFEMKDWCFFLFLHDLGQAKKMKVKLLENSEQGFAEKLGMFQM